MFKRPEVSDEINERYSYEAVAQTLTADELGTYLTYGIRVSLAERELAFVSDVTADRREIETLVKLCNDGQLDPVHLNDVIEDFLADGAEV